MTVKLSLKIGLCVLWLLTVGVGMAMFSNYQSQGGQAGTAPGQWPVGTPVTLDPKRDTLLMFAHPQCPCTRASMEELNRLLARCDGRVAAHVVFFKPANFGDSWVQAGLWHSASAIPGVTVQADPDGATARKFGAETSGYVLLYDPHGQLLFKGGITGSRGHAGDNAGEDSIIALVNGGDSALKFTVVYGCSLLNRVCVPEMAVK